MQDINGYERFIGLLPGCYSMGVSHPETFVAGANLVLNSAEAPLTALTLYGKSTQDGTPSPENPVPIVNIGDSGTINITLSDSGSQSQTLPVSTPNGLPGIPVSSGGNYTDESGQQWVCDEVDFKRGKYVQRIDVQVISRDAEWSFQNISNHLSTPRLNIPSNIPISGTIMCDFSEDISTGNNYLNVLTDMPLEDFKSVMSTQDHYVYYGLTESIETDLPAEEIAAYKAMHTYSPTTTVSNDAGAWMKVGYYSNAALEKMSREALKINGGNLK